MTVADFAYKVEGKAVRTANRLFRAHPSSAPFASGDAYRALADHALDEDSAISPGSVKKGDVVFVATHELPRFKAEVLPGIDERFVLVTHNSDWNIDGSNIELAADERIVRWFAQNALLRHPKLTSIPIGLENRWRHNNGIVGDYRRLGRKAGERRPRIAFGFSVGTNPKERQPALDALRKAPAADELAWTNSRDYRRRLREYGFVASPAGNGVDCHRTWEALYLGVIPVVRDSVFHEGFPGLPALFVGDWSELLGWDEARLREAHERIAPSIAAYGAMWMPYWVARIREARELAR